MRWPLGNQILIRLLLLLFVTIGAVTLANIRSVIQANRNREIGQLAELATLLRDSRFPLNDTVLESMKSLSGAEFVVHDTKGRTLARTSNAPNTLPAANSNPIEADQVQNERVFLDSKAYYYQAIKKSEPQVRDNTVNTVHIFVPRQTDRQVWWHASKSPLLIAICILPIVVLLSLAMSRQVTRPLSRFRKQVLDIADGRLQRIPVSDRNDEIGDLNNSINEMAIRLQDHDRQLRQNERLNAMVQFGNGIAHHLRNSATGCKLAIELLADERAEVAESENFQVATRQLEIMDNYIKKFWLLSQTPSPDSESSTSFTDLTLVLRGVEFLVRPSTRHLDVELSIDVEPDLPEVEMNHDDAQQLMINLISNAITAASENSASRSGNRRAMVRVHLGRDAENRILFSVSDNGAGPPAAIESEMFQPFVTGSREGTGLGLSLVQEIADANGSTFDWKREDDLTIFQFRFAIKNTRES